MAISNFFKLKYKIQPFLGYFVLLIIHRFLTFPRVQFSFLVSTGKNIKKIEQGREKLPNRATGYFHYLQLFLDMSTRTINSSRRFFSCVFGFWLLQGTGQVVNTRREWGLGEQVQKAAQVCCYGVQLDCFSKEGMFALTQNHLIYPLYFSSLVCALVYGDTHTFAPFHLLTQSLGFRSMG